MACYYASYKDMLVLKCDGCGKSVYLFKGETDRCLKHDYIRENEWKTMRLFGKFVDICPECKKSLEEQRRSEWIDKVKGGL